VQNLMHAIKTNHLGLEIWDFCTLDRSFEIEPYAGAPFLRVFCARACPVFAEAPSEAEGGVEGVGTTLIAQWALPFTPAVPQMSVCKIKI
jgi:hypothetical protein